MKIRETARRWLELDWTARRALLHAWTMGVVCTLALRWLSYERVRQIMRRMSVRYDMEIGKIAWTVNAGVSRAPGAKCLARAMVGEALLRASGQAAEICIGVSAQGRFGAHAWVEVGGRAVIGGEADRDYERLLPRGAGTA